MKRDTNNATLPDWIEDRVQELADDSWDDQARQWKRICIIGELLDAYEPRTKERAAVEQMIAERARRKKATQRVYCRLWATVKADAGEGEVRVPQNIDPSTARTIVEHGGDITVIRQADAEGWTLLQARAWAQGRAKVREGKPITFWRLLTKAVDADIRKSTDALHDDQRARFMAQVRQAMAEFGGAHG